MSLVIMIVGTSGSGKSYLEKSLLSSHPNEFKKIISTTSRQPRSGEVNGVDYHFISREEFLSLKKENKLVQSTEFSSNFYGTSVSEYQDKKDYFLFPIVPVEIEPVKKYLEKNLPELNMVTVLFDISSEKIRSNMLSRGDSEEMISKRLSEDNILSSFKELKLKADYIVTDDDLNENLSKDFYNFLRSNYDYNYSK